MNLKEQYPTIAEATLMMASGRLNHLDGLLQQCGDFLSKYYEDKALLQVEEVLSKMDKEMLNDILSGCDVWEHRCAADILAEMMLNDIFTEVICL